MAAAGSQRVFALMDEAVEEDEGYVTLVNAKIDGKGNISESKSRTGIWAWKNIHSDGEITYTKLEFKVQENCPFIVYPSSILIVACAKFKF